MHAPRTANQRLCHELPPPPSPPSWPSCARWSCASCASLSPNANNLWLFGAICRALRNSSRTPTAFNWPLFAASTVRRSVVSQENPSPRNAARLTSSRLKNCGPSSEGTAVTSASTNASTSGPPRRRGRLARSRSAQATPPGGSAPLAGPPSSGICAVTAKSNTRVSLQHVTLQPLSHSRSPIAEGQRTFKADR